MKLSIDDIKNYLLDLQNQICDFLELEEGQEKFIEEQWCYQAGDGGGISRLLSQGKIIEKAGVNFSHVHGKSLPAAATIKRPELKEAPFQAIGTSVVVHPKNPYIPTAHANLRFILVEKDDQAPEWWFGGGFDLTPYYGFEEDCIHWHATAKTACEPFGEQVYYHFKRECDRYFYLKHRNEPRGIGGLFFDDLNSWGMEKSFAFVRQVGHCFVKEYQPIMHKRKLFTYSERERAFQAYRRGRYVEFNLLYDRGTLFGLQSGGRSESILMSLPPIATWHSSPNFAEDERKLLTQFLHAKEW